MPIKLMPAINGNPEWGDIAGSLEFQSDLKNALDDKSSQLHNHNLNDLNEKSYNSLDDLPNLNNFAQIDNFSKPLPCYTTDGVDDYFEIKSMPDIDLSENFSIIIRTSVNNHGEFKVLAAKGVRSLNTGWTLFCDYGVVGFSIGDGTKYLTATHSIIIEENKIYQIAVSFQFSTHQLLIGIDDNVQIFDLTSLSEPEGNSDSILISKNPDSSSFTEMSMHSFIYFKNTLDTSSIIQLYGNGHFDMLSEITVQNDMIIALIPISFGAHFWFDYSGNEHHSSILGSMLPAYKTQDIIIPLLSLNSDINLLNAIPAAYSVEYVVCLNHYYTSIKLSLTIGSSTVINTELIESDEEKTFAINHLESLYQNSDITIEFDLANVDCDIHIILRKQLQVL